jgi:hypothetical protein
MVCLLVLLTSISIGQTIISYGDSPLLEKQIQYEKYRAKIIPHIKLKDQYSFYFDVVFEIKWFDKKDKQVDVPDNIFVYMVDNYNNLTKYCNTNTKKLRDDRKNGTKLMFPTSVQIEPKSHFIIGQLNDGFVKGSSNPLKVKIKEYYTSPVTLNLILYFGKFKKDEVIILNQSVKINWEFILPEPKSDEGLSCKDLVRKYSGEFKSSKSSEIWSRYENKYDLNLNKEATVQDWKALKSSVDDYKLSLEAVREVLSRIQNTKDTLFCDGLMVLKDQIREYLSVEKRVDELISNINEKIASAGSGTSQGPGGFVPSRFFKENAHIIERYYKALWDYIHQIGGNINASQSVIKAYEDSIAATRKVQDSIIQSIENTDNQSLAEFYARNYEIFYNDINELLGKYTPEKKAGQEGAEAMAGNSKPGKRKSYRFIWVIIPIVILVVIFFILRKYFPKFGRVLMLRNKYRGMKSRFKN